MKEIVKMSYHDWLKMYKKDTKGGDTMNGKHTEGKWRVLDGAILSGKINKYGNWIIAGLDRVRTEEDEANLRLMAAAPELLAACKMALSALDNCALYTREGQIYAIPGNSKEQKQLSAVIAAAGRE